MLHPAYSPDGTPSNYQLGWQAISKCWASAKMGWWLYRCQTNIVLFARHRHIARNKGRTGRKWWNIFWLIYIVPISILIWKIDQNTCSHLLISIYILNLLLFFIVFFEFIYLIFDIVSLFQHIYHKRREALHIQSCTKFCTIVCFNRTQTLKSNLNMGD